MVELRRTVRANLGGGLGDIPEPGVNGHAGRPAMVGLGTYYEFEVVCRGEPDEATGYLINIKAIDEAVRETVLPRVHRALRESPSTSPADLVSKLARELSAALPVTLRSLIWRLSPTLSLEFSMVAPTDVLLAQRFEFAAAHRLNVPSLSEDENLATFGKCNNPNGHGHNYELEVCVRLPETEHGFSAHRLDSIVDETIIQRFDHKHLNLDTPEFALEGGLNPSVENIARVCHDLLEPAIREASENVRLERVTVWETPKTSCTYPAPH